MKLIHLVLYVFSSIVVHAQVAEWKQTTKTKIQLQSNESISLDNANIEMAEFGLKTSVKQERLMFIKGNASYSTYYTGQNEKWRIVKRNNGSEVGFLEFEVAGGAETINDEGYMVVNDFSHGDGGIFEFYSPDLKKLNTYKPFLNGYDMMQIGSKKDRVCIYSLQTNNSPNYKIAMLDKTGNLLAEKEYTIGKQNAFKIEMSDGIALLFLQVFERGSNRYNTKVIAFNPDLSKLWEKNYDTGYTIASNPKTHDIIFRQGDGRITCLNAINGETKWVLNSSKILNEYQKSGFQAEYTKDGEALVVNLSLYNNQAERFDENILAILDPTTGKIEFMETQGPSLKRLKVIPMDHKFMLLKDSQILEFSNNPKQ